MSSGIEFPPHSNPKAVIESENGYLTPGAITDAAEQALSPRDPELAYWTFCGDERPVDMASVTQLDQLPVAGTSQRTAPVEAGGIALYGAAAGFAHNVLAATMVQAGGETEAEAAFYKLGGLEGAQTLLRDRLGRLALFPARPALHTATDKEIIAFSESAEGDVKSLFCSHGNSATGCAYCMNIGAVSEGVGNNTDLQEYIGNDLAYLNAGKESRWAERIFATHRQLARLLPAAYGRQAYRQAGADIMVLEGGPHAQASHTGLLINFDPETVSKPGRVYRSDLAAATLAIRAALPELSLDSHLLMESMAAATVPTRAVLASHDIANHTPDPRRIAIGAHGGSIDEAAEAVSRLLAR